jgi:hypothetical protein
MNGIIESSLFCLAAHAPPCSYLRLEQANGPSLRVDSHVEAFGFDMVLLPVVSCLGHVG